MPIPVQPAHREAAHHLAEGFDELLDELAAGEVYRVGVRPAPPQLPGVYLFAEDDVVLHVGRTRNLQARRRAQTALGGNRNSATHAFRRATEAARDDGLQLPAGRAEREADPAFAHYFLAAKQRLRDCDFQFVELEDPPIQATFEIFASIAFGLPRELWPTH